MRLAKYENLSQEAMSESRLCSKNLGLCGHVRAETSDCDSDDAEPEQCGSSAVSVPAEGACNTSGGWGLGVMGEAWGFKGCARVVGGGAQGLLCSTRPGGPCAWLSSGTASGHDGVCN